MTYVGEALGIEKYRLARCDLLRLPTITLQTHQKYIEERIVEMWKEGVRIEDALERLSKDEKILYQLAPTVTQQFA